MVCSESIVYYAGVFFLFRFAVNFLWYLNDALKAFVYPKIFSIDYKKKYGEWAVITGCTQGIGKNYAEDMARRGLNVVLISRTKSKLDNLANDLNKKYGVSTRIITADFMDPKCLPRIVQELEQFNIDIGVLVNNVGMLGEHHMPFLELPQEDVIGMVNVNVLAGTYLCHSLMPKMKAKGKGAVINVSSSANLIFIPYLAVYAATKHYMTAFTMAIAEEYKGSGIEIQCLEPGAVKTSMTTHFDEAGAFIFPPLDTYTKSSCRTLGFTRRTCGYIGHSVMMGFSGLLMDRKENPIMCRLMALSGKGTYENALKTKQKSQ